MAAINRRTFLKGAAGAAAATVVTIAGTQSTRKVFGANDRLNIAVVGLRGRGRSHLGAYHGMDNVEVTWVVDPDTTLHEGHDCKKTTDIREALADDSLDAISVATPNHWHSMCVILAAQAGKHCFVEKPVSHDILEGRVALEAARKYGVVVQHGTQQRSSQERNDMIQAIRSGKYGRLAVSHGFACKSRAGIGFDPASPPPDTLDWNLWRGPAVLDRFHWNKYVHYDWHWFWETGNGEMNNQGTHQLDVAYWALDEGMTHPVRAMCVGGRFAWDDQGVTPNSQFAIAEYPNGQYVFFNVRNVNYDGYQHEVENRFYFEDGGRIVEKQVDGRTRNVYISPTGAEEVMTGEHVEITPGGHYGSFVNACLAGDPAKSNAPMDVAHYSTLLGHVMNNSYRLGTSKPFKMSSVDVDVNKWAVEEFESFHKVMRDGVGLPEDGTEYVVGPWLTFDPATERFVGEHAEEANQLVRDPRMPEFDIPEPHAV